MTVYVPCQVTASMLPLWADTGMCGNKTLIATVTPSTSAPVMPSTLVILVQMNFSFSQPFCWIFTGTDPSSVTRSHQIAEIFQTFMTELVRVWCIAFLICPPFPLLPDFCLPVVPPSNFPPTQAFPASAHPPAEWRWEIVLSCFPLALSLPQSSHHTICACSVWACDVSSVPRFSRPGGPPHPSPQSPISIALVLQSQGRAFGFPYLVGLPGNHKLQ